MDEKQQVQKYLQNYIKDNRGTYTPEVIRSKLLEAGYENGEINVAFEAMGIDEQVKRKYRNPKAAYKDDWRSASANPFGFFLFFPGVPILGWFLLSMTGYGGFFYNIWSYSASTYLMFMLYLGTFLIGTFLPAWIKDKNPELAKGMIYGFRTLLVIFVVLPVCGFLVLWGICMAQCGGSMYC